MEKSEQAITIWIDESTEILIKKQSYNLIGYLITNSDKEEFDFLNKLRQSRKKDIGCWTVMHGNEISDNDIRKLNLLEKWLVLFKNSNSVYFHLFLYKKNGKYISKNKTYEHYFAKQCIFSLANKMKKSGYTINTMFKNVSTLTVLFDRRRSHVADIIVKNDLNNIERFNELDEIYKTEIENQIQKISGKNTKTTELTVRFSFVSSECFDAMQFCDCLLYLVRKKIEQENEGDENTFTKMFDKYFLNDLNKHTKNLSFKKIYEYSKKFNFFESNQ